jgi:hypothetical protein
MRWRQGLLQREQTEHAGKTSLPRVRSAKPKLENVLVARSWADVAVKQSACKPLKYLLFSFITIYAFYGLCSHDGMRGSYE